MTVRRAINPPSLPKPIGPYSNGLLAPPGRLLAIAGLAGVGADGRAALGVANQTRIIFENMRTIVEAAGGTMQDLISLTIYLKDGATYGEVSAVRKEFLSEPYPVSATVTGIGFLTEGMDIEISGLAVIPTGQP